MNPLELLILAVLALGYFFPVVVAAGRDHPQTLAIGMLTLLLGWTGLGWIGALVWACTAIPSAHHG